MRCGSDSLSANRRKAPQTEVITSEDVERILGPRPWTSRSDELLEANAQQAAEEKPKKKRAPRKPKAEETEQ